MAARPPLPDSVLVQVLALLPLRDRLRAQLAVSSPSPTFSVSIYTSLHQSPNSFKNT
uniref:F-box domain-containing protein n=1 Tax=Serinus canaria TaxID=9135 RepID=A0A8C9N001_SERCA